MNNLLPRSVKMHIKYDLKGSTYKRRASQKEREKPLPTLKDLDFLQDIPDGLFLDADMYNALCKTLQRDCLVSLSCFLLFQTPKIPVTKTAWLFLASNLWDSASLHMSQTSLKINFALDHCCAFTFLLPPCLSSPIWLFFLLYHPLGLVIVHALLSYQHHHS